MLLISNTQGSSDDDAPLPAAAFIMIRRTTEDMVFTTDDPHFAPQGGRVPVEKGTTLIVNMVGMRTPFFYSSASLILY